MGGTLSFTAIGSAVAEAFVLLRAHPWQWLLIVVSFLIAAESLMFIPYIGFSAKIAAANVLAANILAIFANAAAGEKPRARQLFSAFSRPIDGQLALVASGLLPFAAGIAFLYVRGGPSATEFFFSNILRVRPPDPGLFVQFKYVMVAVDLPFAFVAGAVVLKGLGGFTALTTALHAAAKNWLAILVVGVLGLCYEWLSGQLSSLIPNSAATAAAVGGLLLLADLAISFALAYTLSVRVFGQPGTQSAA